MPMKFNKGGYENPTSTIGKQPNDKFWSRAAVVEAKKDLVFSQLGAKRKQPKHYGDKMIEIVEIPIIDKRNITDQGIDANGVKMVPNVWYAYDAAGKRVTAGANADNGQGYNTKPEALTAAGANGSIKSGNANLYGSSKDIRVQNGAFPILREEGGRVNVVGLKRETIEATLVEYGFSLEFTKKELDMDSESGILAKYTKEVGRAYGELREAIIRNGLIAASEAFRLYSGAATAIDQMNDTSVLNYKILRQMDKALKDVRCPYHTRILTGANKYGTIAIGKARYAYVGNELRPILEDMDHLGRNIWVPVEDYAYGKDYAMNEIGRIGPFRFLEVEEMPNYAGQGAVATNADFYSSVGADGQNRYDVFPILFVGEDSFATVGFSGDVARVQTALPKIIPGLDNYGKLGVVSISFYNALLIRRANRIRQILTTCKIA